MKSLIARAKTQKGFYLGDHGTHSKWVSGGKSLIKEGLFLTALLITPGLFYFWSHEKPDYLRFYKLYTVGFVNIHGENCAGIIAGERSLS